MKVSIADRPKDKPTFGLDDTHTESGDNLHTEECKPEEKIQLWTTQPQNLSLMNYVARIFRTLLQPFYLDSSPHLIFCGNPLKQITQH